MPFHTCEGSSSLAAATGSPTCRTCAHWCPFNQFYDDELEPEDVGWCQIDNKGGAMGVATEDTDTCDRWLCGNC